MLHNAKLYSKKCERLNELFSTRVLFSQWREATRKPENMEMKRLLDTPAIENNSRISSEASLQNREDVW